MGWAPKAAFGSTLTVKGLVSWGRKLHVSYHACRSQPSLVVYLGGLSGTGFAATDLGKCVTLAGQCSEASEAWCGSEWGRNEDAGQSSLDQDYMAWCGAAVMTAGQYLKQL